MAAAPPAQQQRLRRKAERWQNARARAAGADPSAPHALRRDDARAARCWRSSDSSAFQQLPPDEKQRMREAMRRYHALPPEERRMLRERFERYRRAPQSAQPSSDECRLRAIQSSGEHATRRRERIAEAAHAILANARRVFGEIAMQRRPRRRGDNGRSGRAGPSRRRRIAPFEDLGREESGQRKHLVDMQSRAMRDSPRRRPSRTSMIDFVDDHASARLASSAPTMPIVMMIV